jgi:nucleotide-binding universal stress UspA family protein
MVDVNQRFKTIVVTTDLNEAASPALRYAQALTRSCHAALVIVHVVDPLAYAYPKATLSTLGISAQKELQRIEEEIQEQGSPVYSITEPGMVSERILEVVKDHHADLLILGTRARTEIGRLALGRAARKLLTECPCPILAISPADDPASLPWCECWPRVLAATDFSPVSIEALHYAHHIALRELIVLHVSTTREGSANFREKLRFFAPLNESNTVPVEHFVVPGDPAEMIAEYAHKFGVSLVVLGSPQKVLSEDEFKESTVLNVITKVKCPVLCLPLAHDSARLEAVGRTAQP